MIFSPRTSWLPIVPSVLAALWTVAWPALAATAERTPQEVLAKQYRLMRSGSTWIVPSEQQLRSKLEALPALRKRIQDGESELVESAKIRLLLWAQRPQQEVAVAELQRRVNAASPSEKSMLQEELIRQQAILSRAIPPARLANAPEIRAALMNLIAARYALIAATAWIREELPRIALEYEWLRETPGVSAALEQAGTGQRLGPLRDYRPDLRKLREFEEVVLRSTLFAESTPIYLEGEQVRVVGLVSEETPLTFTWTSGDEPVLITTNAAAAAGLSPAAEGASRVIQRGGRSFTVRPITIPYLRIGPHLVREVPAFLLPPEGEDLGSQLSATSLPGFNARLELEQFRLRLVPMR